MALRDIIVIGASAGGFEAIKRLIADLPPDLPASIFIVWHIAPTIRGVMPQVLNQLNTIPAEYALDNEPIIAHRIYIAPSDHHLLVEDGRVRVTHGPKENRFRPAVDPLFRSAAYAYGSRVIGMVLSGALDDGTAGLWTIKHRGGLAIVQDPWDAEVPSMPENALREVAVDHAVPVAQMGKLLAQLCTQEVVEMENEGKDELLKAEIGIAEIGIVEENNVLEKGIMQFGELSPFACPECHGVLSAISEGNRTRFRCHTGHAYSANVLLASITEKIEDSLWNALRGVEESVMLLNHMGDHFAEANHPRLASLYFQKANEASEQARSIRESVINREQLSEDGLREQAQAEEQQAQEQQPEA